MILRKHLIFSGRVQGVGFRYQARHLAQSLGLTGWVKNLWDERVEMEVQGEEAQIYRLIEELSRGRFIYIERVESETIPVDYHESSFRVTGYYRAHRVGAVGNVRKGSIHNERYYRTDAPGLGQESTGPD